MRVEGTPASPAGSALTPMGEAVPDPKRHGFGIGFYSLLLVAAAAIGWFVYKGISDRVSAETVLVRETHAEAVLNVSVVRPKQSGATEDLVLPGNTQPLMEAPIYARAS